MGASIIVTGCLFFHLSGNCSKYCHSFQQAKKGLLTLTVRTRLTAPPTLCSHLSPPLCRSLSSSTCGAQDSSPFSLESPASPASTAKPNYRIMVEVSLKKGRNAVPAFPTAFPCHRETAQERLTSRCYFYPAGLDIRSHPPSAPPPSATTSRLLAF